MATIRTGSLVPPLGDLCTIQIDPQWPRARMEAFLQGSGTVKKKLSLTFIDLEQGLSEDAQPTYAATEVIGRAEQYQTFVGASNRVYNVLLKFQAQGLDKALSDVYAARKVAEGALGFIGGAQFEMLATFEMESARAAILEREVVDPVIWLEALKQPITGADGISHAPPPVLLTIGRLVRSSRCIVTAATPTFTVPFDPETLLPFAAEVQMTFTVVRKEIKSNLFLHHRQYG